MAHSDVDFIYDRIKDGLMFLPLALRQISLLGATMMISRMGPCLALCILCFVLSGEDPVEVNRARTDRRR